MRSDDPSQYCIAIKMYLYTVLSIQINRTKYIHTPKYFTPQLSLQPNTEADIDIIARCIIDNIDFISQNSSKRGGGWISLSSRVLYGSSVVSVN
jgi:hypothetical protein